MEPGFHRGDILFLNMGTAPIRTGEIVVFNLDGRDIPIVHRVIKVHERSSKDHIDILTKVGAGSRGPQGAGTQHARPWCNRRSHRCLSNMCSLGGS
jgi:signal peptidase